jgi:hypothetical protein
MREFFIHYSLFSHFFENPNPHYFENLRLSFTYRSDECLVVSSQHQTISQMGRTMFVTERYFKAWAFNEFFFIYLQCITNGINYDKLKDGSGKRVRRLEMFFSGFPEIVGMLYFPNLVMLCIMGQDTLEKIEGLEGLVHLEELWICEANVKVCRCHIQDG